MKSNRVTMMLSADNVKAARMMQAKKIAMWNENFSFSSIVDEILTNYFKGKKI